MEKAKQIFLKNGFDAKDVEKIFNAHLKHKENPFQNTDIQKRLSDFFKIFDAFKINTQCFAFLVRFS